MAIAKKGRKNVSLHSCPVAIIYYKFFSLLYDGFRDFLLQIGNKHRHTSQKYTINGYLIIKMSHSFFSRDSIVIASQVVCLRVRNKRKDVCVYFTTTTKNWPLQSWLTEFIYCIMNIACNISLLMKKTITESPLLMNALKGRLNLINLTSWMNK